MYFCDKCRKTISSIHIYTYVLNAQSLELVSKELNHFAAILHVYAGSLIFCEVKKKYYFSKRKGKYFYTFNHFYSEKSSKRAKYHKSTTMTPNLPE